MSSIRSHLRIFLGNVLLDHKYIIYFNKQVSEQKVMQHSSVLRTTDDSYLRK